MANSRKLITDGMDLVVNCFQISNFVLWQTAAIVYTFKAVSCELLSN